MLKIENIDVYYGKFQVIWDLSLEITDGEIFAVIGGNGAGKSTLLRTITGLNKVTRGKITFDNQNINNLSVEKIVKLGISMVPEGRRLFGGMTILENLEMGAFLREPRQKKDQNIESVFELFPVLKERAKQLACTLSGGEQQMLALGRSLMSNPKLLIMDEVSQGLAPLVIQNIAKMIRVINELKGLTILLVEQSIYLASSLAHRAGILENGHLVAQNEARLLLSQKYAKDAYLGVKG